MAILVSPGVDIQVIDESIVASSGPGTVPLIFIATKENKTLNTPQGPVSNVVAPGTLRQNANQLFFITSQRELIQTFGDPEFYTVQGTPIPGYELNEYGLFAAYSYLGIANRAYVLRADLDLGQMEPTVFEPTNPALTGTHWLDLNETVWGLFSSNGGPVPGTAWDVRNPFVIGSRANTETIVIGDGGPVPFAGFDDNDIDTVGVAGTLEINNGSVAVAATDTVNDVVAAINGANILNIKAMALRLGGRSYIVIRNTASATIAFGGTGAVVTGLGFDQPTQITQPSLSIGQNGDTAVMPVLSDNLYFERIRPTDVFGESDPEAVSFWFLIGSTSWREATPTTSTGVDISTYLGQNIIPGDGLDISDGTDTVNVVFGPGDVANLNLVVAKIDADITAANLQGKFAVSLNSAFRIVISNILGGDLFLTEAPGNSSITVLGPLQLASVNGNRLFYAPHFQVPAGSASGDFWIKTTTPNQGANYVVKVYNRNTGIWSILPAPFYLNDDRALAGLGTGIAAGNLYVRYNLYGTTTNPIASQLIRRYRGPVEVSILGDGIPGQTTPSLVPGDQFVVIAGQTNGIQSSAIVTVSGTALEDVVTDINNIPIANVTATVEAGFLKVFNNDGFSLALSYYDSLSDTFVDVGNSGDPLVSLGVTDGLQVSRWEDLAYVASFTEPRTQAEAGRLWYNEDFLADIMVNDGDQWFGYRNYFPTTDPNGVQIAGSPPLTQSDGTPLVENDLWIDGTDLENYPRLYRWRSGTQEWELIDNSDQTTPFGIVFSDARWTATGQNDGGRTQGDFVVSDFVDPDAPDPRTYPAGMLLFNTRASTYNVKEWTPEHFAEFVGEEESPGVQYSVGFTNFPTDTITRENRGRWVTISGNQVDGTPFMGRKAQRAMVVRALASIIISNQDIRSEATFFNLLTAPGYPELIDELITLNTDQKETAFIIGDTPARLAPSGTAIQQWATNFNNAPSTGEQGLTVANTYVGLYYPWGLATNVDGNEVVVPPSHIALRTYAFNDSVAFPWFAPAGFNRGLVTNASSVGFINSEGEYQAVILNQGQRDVLYTNNLNPIAFIPNRGLVVFGQKTLHPVDSALDRVNVARLINYLRFNFDLIAKPFLFEPNDKQTRDQVQSVFERFIGNLVSLRAIFDFAVVCDETNNTPTRIDRNELWIDVAVQPVKAIEFIYIPIRIRNTGDDLGFIPPQSL